MKKFFPLLILSIFTISYVIGKPTANEYIVIAWNDLGMHCSNKDFSTLVVLPPYNNLRAQVIKRGSDGSMPQIINSGIKVTYEIPGNTYSVGKTNFWDYAKKLFGIDLQPNIGLKGAGLSGEMKAVSDHFEIDGIPITPYTDNELNKEDPYQQALVKVFDLNGNLLASSTPVIPVSNEIGCVSSGCHNSEQGILNSHPKEGGFDPNNKPILCASCHASNALGTTGNSEAQSLSYRIHNKHSGKTSDCYKCHPGPNTKCFRDIMFQSGKVCSDCHGTMSQIAGTIKSGRRPWLDEPSCDKSGCHSSHFAPQTGKLFKDSQGHGHIFCSGCHGSPHAIYPTVQPRDNEQIISLQGFSGKLKNCSVCHGFIPNVPGPHGFIYTDVKNISQNNFNNSKIISINPNPSSGMSTVKFCLNKSSLVKIIISDLNGRQIAYLVSKILDQGEYDVPATLSFLNNGRYFSSLVIDNNIVNSYKFIINK